MLKKSRKSAALLGFFCAASTFVGLILFERPNLVKIEQLSFVIISGLVLLAVATFTFYTIVIRLDARYYGLEGALGWILTGIFTALTVGFGQRIWPDPFGLAVVSVAGFLIFRILVFQAIWWAQARFRPKERE